MKALFIIFFMGLSFTALANNGNNGNENNTTPNPTENNTVLSKTEQETKNTKVAKTATTASAVKTEETSTVKPITKKGSSRVCTTGTEVPRYGISSFFVELIHTGNIKLVKMLLDD
ncbi:hypothetical protein GN157_07710 [Flavobacterium rakeshii]|uniref:Ankyrin repeat domain-containing protein n=1 Tax=Flavobacterium rakeshii TaxID=1038845 RepID=A0A6N8HAM5_9FLAO|nr:hypothetical protein [Flavobacterium rakeshii]MEE1896879.1 hypothetical protein [Flavobacterium rakeshii]MUV03594.1 hypothetical protein [Flavobacterium rakeshii]